MDFFNVFNKDSEEINQEPDNKLKVLLNSLENNTPTEDCKIETKPLLPEDIRKELKKKLKEGGYIILNRPLNTYENGPCIFFDKEKKQLYKADYSYRQLTPSEKEEYERYGKLYWELYEKDQRLFDALPDEPSESRLDRYNRESDEIWKEIDIVNEAQARIGKDQLKITNQATITIEEADQYIDEIVDLTMKETLKKDELANWLDD